MKLTYIVACTLVVMAALLAGVEWVFSPRDNDAVPVAVSTPAVLLNNGDVPMAGEGKPAMASVEPTPTPDLPSPKPTKEAIMPDASEISPATLNDPLYKQIYEPEQAATRSAQRHRRHPVSLAPVPTATPVPAMTARIRGANADAAARYVRYLLLRADPSVKITRISAVQQGDTTTIVNAEVRTDYETLDDTFTLDRRPEGFVVVSRNEVPPPGQASAKATPFPPPGNPSQ
jgi:hypothetical protein